MSSLFAGITYCSHDQQFDRQIEDKINLKNKFNNSAGSNCKCE